jgi:hypothetical protein
VRRRLIDRTTTTPRIYGGHEAPIAWRARLHDLSSRRDRCPSRTPLTHHAMRVSDMLGQWGLDCWCWVGVEWDPRPGGGSCLGRPWPSVFSGHCDCSLVKVTGWRARERARSPWLGAGHARATSCMWRQRHDVTGRGPLPPWFPCRRRDHDQRPSLCLRIFFAQKSCGFGGVDLRLIVLSMRSVLRKKLFYNLKIMADKLKRIKIYYREFLSLWLFSVCGCKLSRCSIYRAIIL